jgi:hypothetical protein
MLGMHVDSDAAFIENREEYGSSRSSSNHSSEDNVVSYVCMVTRNDH